MKPSAACSGKYIDDRYRLEYQILTLEFVRNKSLKLEVVFYNPHNPIYREEYFKFATNNLDFETERLALATHILDGLIKRLDLTKENLYKLIVRESNAFYLCIAK